MVIDIYKKCIRGKLRWRDSDPTTVDALVERLTEWLPENVELSLSGNPDVAEKSRQQLLDLADQIDGDCPDSFILKSIGVSTASVPPISVTNPGKTGMVAASLQGQPAIRRVDVELIVSAEVIAHVRSILKPYLDKEVKIDKTSQKQIKEAIGREDWSTARRSSASIVTQVTQKSANESIPDLEALYAIVLVHDVMQIESSPQETSLLESACLCAAISDLGYFINNSLLEELVIDMFLRLGGEQSSTRNRINCSGDLGELFSKLAELPPTDIKSNPIALLFGKARQIVVPRYGRASCRLARWLWESQTGNPYNFKTRASLLFVLFQIRQSEALEELAKDCEPHQDLVQNCMRAFERAESNPEARPHALRLSAALREKGGLRPWVSLFRLLESSNEGVDELPIESDLESDFIEEDSTGHLSIELRLSPSLLDPPNNLRACLKNNSTISLTLTCTLYHKQLYVCDAIYI